MSLSHVTVICTNRDKEIWSDHNRISTVRVRVRVRVRVTHIRCGNSGNLLPPIYAADRQIRNLSCECNCCKLLLVSWSENYPHCTTGLFLIFVFFFFYLPCFSSSCEQCIDLSTCKLLCTHTDTQLITHSCHLMSESKNNNAAHAHIRLPIYMPYMCRYVQCVFSINQETVHLHKQQQFCENPFQNTPRNNFLFAKYWQVIHQGILWKIKERKEKQLRKNMSIYWKIRPVLFKSENLLWVFWRYLWW